MRAPSLFIAPSRIEGRGCFAAQPFTRGRKVGELRGERISRKEAGRRAARRQRIRICDVDDRTAIDATRGEDATAFINHSCEPNLYTRTVRGHVLFFALRNIRPGDELCLDYGASYHEGRKRCRCAAPRCRGII
jgi:SET domain-containing protein